MSVTYRISCPACNNESMRTSQTEYEVEHFGAVLLSVVICPKCGYKHTDILNLSKREPTALIARVESPDDLKIKVIKSGTATLSIPEFKATITPGPYSESYVSNIEGVLQKIEDALTFMLASAKGKRLKRGEGLLKRIQYARDHEPRFSLVIKDPLGNSGLVSADASKVRRRRLTLRELSSLKFGEFALTQDKVQ